MHKLAGPRDISAILHFSAKFMPRILGTLGALGALGVSLPYRFEVNVTESVISYRSGKDQFHNISSRLSLQYLLLDIQSAPSAVKPVHFH